MEMKPRFASKELQLLRCLDARMTLLDKDKLLLQKLEKGLTGELLVDQLFESSLFADYLLIKDLVLKSGNSGFQMDSLLISSNTCFLIEVKNMEDDYYIEPESGKWYYLKTEKQIKDPLLQVARTETLLQQTFEWLRSPLHIKSVVIFPNSRFYLYQAPKNLPVIFPSQIDSFLERMNKLIGQNSITQKQMSFAEKLVSMHDEESRFTSEVPIYREEDLKKGVVCGGCRRSFAHLQCRKLVCDACGHEEDVDAAVIRSVEEYRLLFPDRLVTTPNVYGWCGYTVPIKTIRRILSKNLQRLGKNRHSHYE